MPYFIMGTELINYKAIKFHLLTVELAMTKNDKPLNSPLKISENSNKKEEQELIFSPPQQKRFM